MVAATLAERGLDVIVLEAAGYFNESDFDQLELSAYQQRYWRGGPTPTADGNVSLVAGTTLGGGTTINWTNCLRTRPWVREQWAREHGLDGVDGPEFDAHLDAVLERIGAGDRCSDLNGPQQRMKEGAEALGWSFETIIRNTDPDSYSPEMAGLSRLRRPVGEQAERRPHLARRCPGARRPLPHPLPRHPGARRGRPRRRGRGRLAAARGRRGRGHRARAAGGGRLRLARVPGAADALGDRRPGDRPLPPPPSLLGGGRRSTAPTRRPGGGRRRPASATSSPTPATATAS